MDLEWVKQQAIAPVYVVRGNNDKEWAENIPIIDAVMAE